MTRLVVVGNGMVGARFTADLLAADVAGRYRVTQFGAESSQAYNRVLLSDVVSGTRDLGSIMMPQLAHARLETSLGSTVCEIDREDRVVVTADGRRTRYDQLVLATGAAARVPDLKGLGTAGEPPRGVRTLRTIDDARGLAAASMNSRSAVVLGAGVLGLEIAAGLARRGVPVTLVHPAPTMMERQLDEASAGVLADAVLGLRIGLRHGATASGIVADEDGIRQVVLSDGERLPCDLLVIAAGAIPSVALARRAGLVIDRGVVVTAGLASVNDPRIFAIGDCAQPPSGWLGLLAQGWSQARALVAHLTGTTVPADSVGTDDVVRLKAPGLDVVTMGICGTRRPDLPGHRALTVADSGAGRHIELVIHRGRLVGATCIGAGPIAAQLLTTYTQRTPLPLDPLALLLDRSAYDLGSAAREEPDDLCRCNSVTRARVLDAVATGAHTVDEIANQTRAGTGCGGCRDELERLLSRGDADAATVKSL